jgi:hypothetical protein
MGNYLIAAGPQVGNSLIVSTLDDVYGSTWLTSGLGSVLALAGNPGDTRVTMLHLKQPAECLEAMTLEHDHATGLTRLLKAQGTVLDVLGGSGADMTAREIAMELFPTVDDTIMQRVRRELRKLTGLELVTRVPATSSKRGAAGEPERWRLVPGAVWMKA